MLEGYTTAGGFEIMVNCDFAIAADDALIGDFHIRRAPVRRRRSDLPPAADRRPAQGEGADADREALDRASEAVEFGLINDWAPAEELDACVASFVKELTDKSPFTMWITKMAINRGLDADTRSLMVMEHFAAGVAMNSERRRRGRRRVPREARARLDRYLSRRG